MSDKLISLNTGDIINSSNCGIEIFGISGNGFIKTSNDSLRYNIKAPLDSNINYISTFDNNYNLFISGNTLLQNLVIMSSLNISGYTTLINNNYINKSLNISGISNFNDCSFNNINVLNNTYMNNTNILNTLYISNTSNFNNLIINSLYSSGLNTFNNLNINNLTISGTSYLNNVNLNMLNINGNINLNNITCLNLLNISGNTIYQNNITINNKLNVSGNSNFNNNLSCNSSLYVTGSNIFNNNITINSNININNNIILKLNNYSDNLSALNSGLNIGSFYRTGGLIKILLDNKPPIISLIGNSIITIATQNYCDPGLLIYDYNNEVINGYLSYLLAGSYTTINTLNLSNLSNLINTPILMSATTLITQTSLLSDGYYTEIYYAKNSLNLSSYNYRLLNIVNTYNIFNTINGNLELNLENTNYNFNSINNSDWTFEIWLYCTNNNANTNYYGLNETVILDFRKPNGSPYTPNYHFWLAIDNNLKPKFSQMNSSITPNISNNINLNQWCHVVWMRYNNNLYTFINGLCSSSSNILSNMNNLTQLYYMVYGIYSDLTVNNITNTNISFNGNMSQPLLSLGAKYNLSGFIPSWNLRPNNFNNTLFWMENNYIDQISNYQITKNKSVTTQLINKPL